MATKKKLNHWIEGKEIQYSYVESCIPYLRIPWDIELSLQIIKNQVYKPRNLPCKVRNISSLPISTSLKGISLIKSSTLKMNSISSLLFLTILASVFVFHTVDADGYGGHGGMINY